MSAADSLRVTRAKQFGCVACLLGGFSGLSCGAPEYHHLLVGGQRVGHQYGIALGEWHHRGVVREGYPAHLMPMKYGPSLAKGSKPFHTLYGDDQFLLDYQNRLLGVPLTAIPNRKARKAYRPSAKIFRRAA